MSVLIQPDPLTTLLPTRPPPSPPSGWCILRFLFPPSYDSSSNPLPHSYDYSSNPPSFLSISLPLQTTPLSHDPTQEVHRTSPRQLAVPDHIMESELNDPPANWNIYTPDPYFLSLFNILKHLNQEYSLTQHPFYYKIIKTI